MSTLQAPTVRQFGLHEVRAVSVMWPLFKLIRRSARFIPEPWHCRLVDGWAWLYEKIHGL